MVQEGLTNITKHANAKNIIVAINRVDQGGIDEVLSVIIEDNGVGIKNTKPKRGLGLVGLRERVESLGGSFSVMPGRGGKGTCVSAQIPIK